MYNIPKMPKTTLNVSVWTEGETLEQKIERITTNNEPIEDGAPIIYTERKDGVLPQYDIRTDRFEIAVEAMEKVTQAALARRDAAIKGREIRDNEPNQKGENISGAEPIHGTSQQPD